jgi:hypothetical protein
VFPELVSQIWNIAKWTMLLPLLRLEIHRRRNRRRDSWLVILIGFLIWRRIRGSLVGRVRIVVILGHGIVDDFCSICTRSALLVISPGMSPFFFLLNRAIITLSLCLSSEYMAR